MKVSYSRLLLILSGFFYIFILEFTYVVSIHVKWEYFGLGLNSLNFFYEGLSSLFALVPLTFSPKKFSRPSVFLYYIQYSLVYVPSILFCQHISIPSLDRLKYLELIICLFIGMLILTLLYRIKIKRLYPIISFNGFFYIIYTFTLIALISLFVIGLNTGATVSAAFSTENDISYVGHQIFTTANEARGNFFYSTNLFGGRIQLYLMFWLAGFILPLIFAFGIFFKHKLNFLIFFLGYIFLFIYAGYKSCLVALVSLPLVWFILSVKSNAVSKLLFLLSSYLLLSQLSLIDYFSQSYAGSWFKMLTDWINLRIFCISPLTIVQYLDFFDSNPLTYMSHVKGFNFFIDYPYTQDIGKRVGLFHYGGGINVNAGLWATDGIAAFGSFGIISSSLICSFLFWIIDSISIDINPKFVILALSYIAITFANTSIFTNILTGGIFLLIMTIYIMPCNFKRQTWFNE